MKFLYHEQRPTVALFFPSSSRRVNFILSFLALEGLTHAILRLHARYKVPLFLKLPVPNRFRHEEGETETGREVEILFRSEKFDR